MKFLKILHLYKEKDMAFKPKQLKASGIIALTLAVIFAGTGIYDHFFQLNKKLLFPFVELFGLSLATGLACIYLSKLKR